MNRRTKWNQMADRFLNASVRSSCYSVIAIVLLIAVIYGMLVTDAGMDASLVRKILESGEYVVTMYVIAVVALVFFLAISGSFVISVVMLFRRKQYETDGRAITGIELRLYSAVVLLLGIAFTVFWAKAFWRSYCYLLFHGCL